MKKAFLFSIPAVVLLVLVSTVQYLVVKQTGHVVYPIDDPYIHLAIAKHYAQEGVFGVSKAGFSAMSSSPLWTWLLGILFWITGVHESIPWVINLCIGMILITYLTMLLSQRLQSQGIAVFFSLFTLFALPLPALIALGMEHTLHVLLSLFIIEQVSHALSESDNRTNSVSIAFLVFLATLTRFESLFLVAVLSLLCVIKRRWRLAGMLVGASALPIVVLGQINIFEGWFFFPTSILLKSALQSGGLTQVNDMMTRLFGQLFGSPHLSVLFAFALVALLSEWKKGCLFSPDSVWLSAFTGTAVLHCSMASVGWFYRYEAYLIAIAVIALAPFGQKILVDLWNQSKLWSDWSEFYFVRTLLVSAILLSPIPFQKNILSIKILVPASRNIYSQQYQMGLFLYDYYEGAAVLANDIGAINFLADIECLDVMGLGSVEPIQAKMQGVWSPRFLHSWCSQHNVSVAIVYESWLRGLIPPTWIKVGEWTVNEKITVADSTVAFFAVNPSEAESLRSHLLEFKTKLPQGVSLQLFD